MIRSSILFLLVLAGQFCLAQQERTPVDREQKPVEYTAQVVNTWDIDNFWEAYDQIKATKDTLEQLQIIQKVYIDRGSKGLKSIMAARRYTAKGYVDAIRRYPAFWNSIRPNMEKAKTLGPEIDEALSKLKMVCPSYKILPAYLTVGLFRTNGTVRDQNLLIGCEMAATNDQVDTHELPENVQYFYQNYKNSLNTMTLLCVHECIHGQQKELQETLLNACIYEGVAEFVSTHVMNMPSNVPAMAYGQMNTKKVFQRFEQDMFIPNRFNQWLWSAQTEIFGMRDMGYYIGYAICEQYYKLAEDKQQAIYDMLNLDYSNEAAIEKFVDKTKLFSKSLKQLNQAFDKTRPTVTSISQFKNGSQNVSPSIRQITLNFSRPMDKGSRGFDYGPLGESHVLSVKNVIGFSEDGKSFTYEVELTPDKKWQVLVTNAFQDTAGIPLKPYMIEFSTGSK